MHDRILYIVLFFIAQIVPHLVNAIQDWIERVSKIPVDYTGDEPEVCIIEASSTEPQKSTLN